MAERLLRPVGAGSQHWACEKTCGICVLLALKEAMVASASPVRVSREEQGWETRKYARSADIQTDENSRGTRVQERSEARTKSRACDNSTNPSSTGSVGDQTAVLEIVCW